MKKFYDVLVEHKNEDGYCVCSITYAGKKAEINLAVCAVLPERLEAMGVIKVYRTLLEPVESDVPHFRHTGGQRYTLIKITDKPFTEELYTNHFYETTTVVRRRRKIKAD